MKREKTMKKIFILSAIAALVMSSCSKDGEEFTTASNQMQFVAEYPTTRATATAFEALWGYLYLLGRYDRLNELFEIILSE